MSTSGQALTSNATVLLVESDPTDGERYGAWLESAGMDLMNCPGPHDPDFTCLGTSNGSCPLVNLADIAVIDVHRLRGISSRGRSGWRLIRYYLGRGKPVVVIADRYRRPSFRREQVFVLRANPGRESLLLAVRALLRQAATW